MHPGQPAQNNQRADIGENRGAKTVEGLREGQAAMRRVHGAQQADQRVGHHLHHGNPTRQHEQRRQKHAKGGAGRGGNEQQAAHHHRQQPHHRPAHIAQPLHHQRPGNGDGEISGKKGRLHQHRLHIVEGEQLLQLGDDHIIQAGDAAKDEEQGHHEQPQFGRIDMGTLLFCRQRVGARCQLRCQSQGSVLP